MCHRLDSTYNDIPTFIDEQRTNCDYLQKAIVIVTSNYHLMHIKWYIKCLCTIVIVSLKNKEDENDLISSIIWKYNHSFRSKKNTHWIILY